jgi:hypothetical protein
MKQLTILTSILCFSFTNLFAEGPPITLDGKIDVPYKAFALTTSQKVELNHARYITLTEQQAKEEGMQNHDRKLFILTSNFNDCCCGLTYGIWFHPDSIAIMGKDYPSKDTLENGMTMPGRSLRHITQLNNYEEKIRSITINAQGDLYYMDKKIPLDIDSMSELLYNITTNLDSLKKTDPLNTPESEFENEPHLLIVNLAPIRGNKHRSDVLYTYYLLQLIDNRNHRSTLFLQ